MKVDDAFPDHPKVQEAGPVAAWLCLAGWCYAARYRTDGRIPHSAIARLIDTNGASADALARKLVAVGLWEEVEGGYLIHDYLEYNPSAAEAEDLKAAARGRMQKVRAARRGKISPEAYLEQSASEPGIVGNRNEADFDHLPPEVRRAGARIRQTPTKGERLTLLAEVLENLGLQR